MRWAKEISVAGALAQVVAGASSVSVKLDGYTFVNKGIVGFGLIPSNAKDSTGDTLGGLGSAISIKRGSFRAGTNGTYTGTLIVQPDRGYNVITTVDWQARQHAIDFVLTPYNATKKLSFADAQKTLQLTYRNTLLYSESGGVKTTGLDALATRPAAGSDPVEPIPSTSYNHLSVDSEGLVLNADGTFWTSDEYGPYIHRFDASGTRLQTIQPPAAILPYIGGVLNFTSNTDPDTGRVGNQGFEGLTISPDGQTLYAMLQSATVQDGGTDKTTSRYTRLLAYSLTTIANPTLVGEWIVPLPQSSKDKTYAQSEIHYLSNTTFLVLSRDGHGRGDDGGDTDSDYKQIDLFSIKSATNIAGTKFDTAATPVAPKGKLDKSVTPATYASFVDMLDDTQLARFGLHNDDPDDETLIDAKWESLALASVGDSAYPDDYFLFTVADNDFQTTDGVSVGQPYDAGIDEDSQFLVFRVTLPSVARGSVV